MQGIADPSRLIIRGSSAGGLSALSAVTVFGDRQPFKAAFARYGISDLDLLGKEDWKAERGHTRALVGAGMTNRLE